MIVFIPTMLSFTLRRVLSHPVVFSTVQMSPTRVISSNHSLSVIVQRNFVTTANDQNSDSTADSEPEPESKSKSKSTRRKIGSSTKAAGKNNKGVSLVSTHMQLFGVLDPS